MVVSMTPAISHGIEQSILEPHFTNMVLNFDSIMDK